MEKHASIETQVVHGQDYGDAEFQDIIPPIHMATTFERSATATYPGGHMYSRLSSPAYRPAEEVIQALEDGKDALVFSSGMAASSAVLQALKSGDRIVAPRSMYWGWRNWMMRFAQDFGLDLVFYDNADLDDLHRLVKEKPTRLLWIETPANPTWEVTDIAAASEIAHQYGAKVLVDSTIGTPVFTKPLLLGADLVMHSATKYLNGHSDVVAGALITKEKDELWERIQFVRGHGGAILGPFESWLLLRGMRTLFVRVRTAAQNALIIAEAMSKHPAVSAVLYPGLPQHPSHAVAKKQMKGGFGAMLSIRFAEGEEKARSIVANLNVFKRATSLGAVESLVEHRASIEGPGTICPPNLLRFSIGIEPVEDLLADLEHAISQKS